MRIVVTGTRGIPEIMGGVETHCEELFPRLSKLGFDIILIRRSSYVQEKNQLTDFKGVKLIDIFAPKKKSLEAFVHTFLAVIKAKKLKADIIHIHAVGPALLTPLARLLGLKVVFTHHGPDYDREKWGLLAKLMLKLGECMGCIFASEVIVISDVIKQICIKKYGRKDAKIIYNGVPDCIIINKKDYLNELALSSRKYIFAMGRFVPEKNFHQLIQAFSLSNKKDFKLVIAGDSDFDDDYSRKLKKLAANENIVLTGFIKGEKLHTLLSNAHSFVLPSSHEGLPISMLEAMTYNLPIIASNIPANLEVRLPSESYFDLGNIKQLSEKINSIIEKDVIRTTYSMDIYNWEKIANQTSEVYQNIQIR